MESGGHLDSKTSAGDMNYTKLVASNKIKFIQSPEMVCFDVHCPYNVTAAIAAANSVATGLPRGVPFVPPPSHFHCSDDNGHCHFVTTEPQKMEKHILELHSNGSNLKFQLRKNFESFDQSVNCQVPGCSSTRRQLIQHWHCASCQIEILDPNGMDSHCCRETNKSESFDSMSNNSQQKGKSASSKDTSRNLFGNKNMSHESSSAAFKMEDADEMDYPDRSETGSRDDSIKIKDNVLADLKSASGILSVNTPNISFSALNSDEEKVSGNFLEFFFYTGDANNDNNLHFFSSRSCRWNFFPSKL